MPLPCRFDNSHRLGKLGLPSEHTFCFFARSDEYGRIARPAAFFIRRYRMSRHFAASVYDFPHGKSVAVSEIEDITFAARHEV